MTRPRRIVATVATVMLILGSWLHGMPSHAMGGADASTTRCAGQLVADVSHGCPGEHSADQAVDGCDLLSCYPAIPTSTASASVRTLPDDGIVVTGRRPARRLAEPPFEPPRLS